MDVTEIKKLMEVLNTTDVTEISLEADGAKLLLKKDMTAARRVLSPAIEAPIVEKKTEETKNIKELISLNVGKFYLDKASIGSRVKDGQKVGYIESVGVKTDVKSDGDGIVREILIENGGIVDFGKIIMKIEKI